MDNSQAFGQSDHCQSGEDHHNRVTGQAVARRSPGEKAEGRLERDVEIERQADAPLHARHPQPVKHERKIQAERDKTREISNRERALGRRNPEIRADATPGEQQEPRRIGKDETNPLAGQRAVERWFAETFESIGNRRDIAAIEARALIRMVGRVEPKAAVRVQQQKIVVDEIVANRPREDERGDDGERE